MVEFFPYREIGEMGCLAVIALQFTGAGHTRLRRRELVRVFSKNISTQLPLPRIEQVWIEALNCGVEQLMRGRLLYLDHFMILVA